MSSSTTTTKPGGGTIHPLYAVTIHNCIAKGDLAEMKNLVLQAEAHLKDHGNVMASLEALRIEIAKLSK